MNGKMKNLIIILGMFVLFTGLGIFFVKKFRELGRISEEVEEYLVVHYLDLIQRQEYAEAYELLGPAFHDSVSQLAFEDSHKKHFADLGKLEKWKYTTSDHEYNLFSQESIIGVRYILTFEKGQAHVVYRVNLNAKPRRIDEILGTTGSSDFLAPGIW